MTIILSYGQKYCTYLDVLTGKLDIDHSAGVLQNFNKHSLSLATSKKPGVMHDRSYNRVCDGRTCMLARERRQMHREAFSRRLGEAVIILDKLTAIRNEF